MWLSKIPQRKKRHSCSEETVGALHGILQEQQHTAFVASKTLNLFQTIPVLWLFFYPMSFLVFHYISDGSSQFHNIILEDFLKIKPEFESTYSLAHVQPPLLFFVSVLPFLKQFLQQMQPALSTQLHYSVCIPANIQLKRNNDFHLNLTSSAVPDVSFTIHFLYLANSNRL